MKKKAFTLIGLMVVILIVGIVAAVAIPILHERTNRVKDEGLKTGYFSSERFKQIVGNDPYQVKEGELTVNIFQVYLYDNTSSFLRFATAKDVEGYLKLKEQSAIGLTEKEREFERKVLEGLMEFKGKAP